MHRYLMSHSAMVRCESSSHLFSRITKTRTKRIPYLLSLEADWLWMMICRERPQHLHELNAIESSPGKISCFPAATDFNHWDFVWTFPDPWEKIKSSVYIVSRLVILCVWLHFPSFGWSRQCAGWLCCPHLFVLSYSVPEQTCLQMKKGKIILKTVSS